MPGKRSARRTPSRLPVPLRLESHPPLRERISKWVCRHICQEVCPWNEKFSLPLREDPFRAREVIAGKDARTPARDILAMSDEDFRMAFNGSPMKRAKLAGLKRNATVVVGNVESRRRNE